MWSIVQGSFGFKSVNFKDWWILRTIQLALIIQLLMHIPFIYYIAKENIMILVDEWQTQSTSRMVDRVRDQNGDPRFYLAELQKNTVPSISEDYLVYLHRQPYMKMSNSQKKKINICLFILMIGMCYVWNYTYNALNVFITL
jgi:hypothetical protein